MTSALRQDRLTALVTDAMSSGGSPWRSVEVRASVGSTNAELLRDPRPWRVLTTDHQVSGRGRLARAWETPPGAAVALSVTVPAATGRAEDWGWLPLLTGLAVRDALLAVGLADAVLKWPNDVLVPGDDERKVCGVLCEMSAAAQVAVLGLGINVHQSREQLPVTTATSLDLCGVRVGREEVVVEVLRALAGRYAQWSSRSRMAELARDYGSACATVGRRVSVHLPTGAVRTGDAVRVDATGRLVVRAEDGEVAHAAGDVVHARLGG